MAGSETLELAAIFRFPYLTGYAGGGGKIEDALLRAAAESGVRLGRASSRTDLSGHVLELETTDTIGFSSLPRGEQNKANGMHVLRLSPIEPTLEIHVAWNPANDELLVNSVISELSRLAERLRERP